MTVCSVSGLGENVPGLLASQPPQQLALDVLQGGGGIQPQLQARLGPVGVDVLHGERVEGAAGSEGGGRRGWVRQGGHLLGSRPRLHSGRGGGGLVGGGGGVGQHWLLGGGVCWQGERAADGDGSLLAGGHHVGGHTALHCADRTCCPTAGLNGRGLVAGGQCVGGDTALHCADRTCRPTAGLNGRGLVAGGQCVGGHTALHCADRTCRPTAGLNGRGLLRLLACTPPLDLT